jgi:hypothetical protein
MVFSNVQAVSKERCVMSEVPKWSPWFDNGRMPGADFDVDDAG